MWPFGMTRIDMTEFLKENIDAFLDILLTINGMDVDAIVMNFMQEEAAEFAKGCWRDY